MKSRNRWCVNIVVILGITVVLSKGNEAEVREFCGKDFTLLGRHNCETAANIEPVVELEQNNHGHQCYCGKSFKTFRGLNSHKCSCHVLAIPDLKSLYEVPLQGTADDIEESNEEDKEIDLDKLSLLTGVKLPKRNSD